MMSVIKRRSANYSKSELDCLLSYLEDNPDLPCGRLGGQFKSLNDLRIAWDELAEKIAVVGGYFGCKRTGQEVKRKWSDLKSRVKAKAATLAMENETPEAIQANMKLTPLEERVLGIFTQTFDDIQIDPKTNIEDQETRVPAVKVFSFDNDSDSGEVVLKELSECDESEGIQIGNLSEGEVVEEIKVSGNEDKKRRFPEDFTVSFAEKRAASLKRLKMASEEEQLQELCIAQHEINTELHSIKDILKKCQMSVEKIALLKQAELKLKCAKYGVDFNDLFD